MLAVVLLLLPVFMTGASLEVPGARCSVQNCCVMAHCHEHDSAGAGHACQMHDQHHHHVHERILLLLDAGAKAPSVAAVAVAQAPQAFVFLPASVCDEVLMEEAWRHPPPYPGYRQPQRC